MNKINPKHKAEEPLMVYNTPTALELITEVLGGVQLLGQRIKNILDFISLSEKGLPISVLKRLQERMNFTNREIGKALDISESTLQRRYKLDQRLDKKESENTIHLASVWAKGLEVFQDEDDFRTWLHTRNTALGNNKPLALLQSPIGREELKDLLSRIEWGVYS